MALSPEEKKLAEDAYGRIRLSRRFRGSGIPAACMGFVASFPSLIKLINDPHASHRAVVFFSGLMGFVVGVCILSACIRSPLRKRDEELVRFFEKHFSDDCSWRQEEKILAEAEDIRLKAKVNLQIQEAAR